MDLSNLMPQQLQIVKTLDRPLFVSAGAGSGKTFTLTRRIVYALSPESGPFVEHLDQVLAITFTKDAAAEIRDRVRRALIDEGMDEEALLDHDPHPDHAADALACAICHVNLSRTRALTGGEFYQQRGTGY